MRRRLILWSLLAPLALFTWSARAQSDGAARRSAGGARLAVGVLSAPRAGAPADIARAFLASRPDLGVAGSDARALPAARVLSTAGGGALIRLEQRHAGLPVIGGGAAVRVDEQGRVRWARSSLAAIAGDLALTPVIDAARAYRAAGGQAADDVSERVRLVIHAPAGGAGPRLAWEVWLPRDLQRLEQIRAWVDAETGALLGRANLVLTAKGHRARAFAENPVATPEETEVVLGDIPVGGERLAGPDIEVFNCIDRRTCTEVPDGEGTTSIHSCELEQVAVTGPAGDFLDIERPARDTDPGDSFAEVQMYFHTTRAYAAFRELVGDPDFVLDSRPLTAVANLRLGTAECEDGAPPAEAELAPLDNAFFASAGDVPLFDRDVIAFGQGLGLDFSYDGDVVYHELGHAFVFRLNDLGFGFVDEAGLDPTPGALHEGYADYLSSVITGDPEVGEYIGGYVNPGLGAIRSLANDFTCPQHLSGESHFDSETWSGALWQIREATAAADRAALDRAVVTALAALGPDDGFTVAHELTAAEIELALGGEAAAAARDVFAARGLADCGGRVVDLALGERRELLLLGGFVQVPGPLVPAPLQFRVELDRPASAIKIGADVLSTSAAAVTLLIKPGDDPIEWSWSEAGGEHDAPITGEIDPESGAGEVAGDFPAGVYHLQLASGPAGVLLGEVGFGATPVAGQPEPDAGAGPEPDAGASAADPADTGCGCRGSSGASGPAGSALLVLGVIAMLAVRRTRRTRPPRPGHR